ncbi:MAG: hypothetical protein IH984_03510 [Planctomycetes bacterium]|nr:hypothetical protein [Planctomycetota bacterium]
MLLLGQFLDAAIAFQDKDSAGSPTAATARAIPASRQANTVAVLTIREDIDRITLRSLERRVRQANRDGANAIVLEIDTNGGDAFVTLDICNLIKTEAPVNSVAWINTKAYSAGTIIALACREIVVAPKSKFGDAAPIKALPGVGLMPLPPAERAKIESPILSEVVDSARQNHYDENLVQAFISVGVELWMIENLSTGEQSFVSKDEYKLVIGEDPPNQKISITPPKTGDSVTIRPVLPWFDISHDGVVGSEEQAPSPEQIKQEIELAQDLPSSRIAFTEADRGKWKLVGQVIANDRLLIVNQNEAIHYGLAQTVIANEEELKAYFGATKIIRYDRSWSESLVRFLTNPIVMGVLIVIMIVCGLIELAAPGLSVFGATAAIAFLILVGAPSLADMAQWWEILLMLIGFVLVVAEIFVIPGLGIAGIAGVICLLIGLVGMFVTGNVTAPTQQSELIVGAVATLTSFLAAGVILWLVAKQVESIPVLNRLVLKSEVGDSQAGATAQVGLLEAMGPRHRALEPNDTGVAATDLRPAGRAMFDGRPVDVKSVGSYIERGKPVRVVTVDRFVIEVEEIET